MMMVLRSGRAKPFRMQKFVTVAPEPERSAKGNNGIKSEAWRAALCRRLSLRKLKRGGNRPSPTSPCARSAGRVDAPRPTADRGRRDR
jgi:hypothetical protein